MAHERLATHQVRRLRTSMDNGIGVLVVLGLIGLFFLVAIVAFREGNEEEDDDDFVR